ncbi:MAG: translation initiation factor eIF-2B [Candidatus Bilamarchaeum sp.]|jgi:ribose 1,5-bisphosphate isomerase
MLPKETREIIDQIKALKIQGARNVAKYAIKALGIVAKESKAKTPDSFYKEMTKAADIIADCRPTEPMMRNMIYDALRFTLMQVRSKNIDMDELKVSISNNEKKMLQKMDLDATNLAKNGARLIPDDGIILTHCHSSTSTKVLIEAKKMKKKFSVICFETRPRYQGRTTATELASAGIDVSLSVDGGMSFSLKKADMVIVGADSITSRGDLINKIGTSALAHLAHMHDVSFYSAAELFKYSPITLLGTREKIEERDHSEVWDNPPRGVKIRNPAFEATSARYINGYITEIGVVPPQALFNLASEKLGIKLNEIKNEIEV